MLMSKYHGFQAYDTLPYTLHWTISKLDIQKCNYAAEVDSEELIINPIHSSLQWAHTTLNCRNIEI